MDVTLAEIFILILHCFYTVPLSTIVVTHYKIEVRTLISFPQTLQQFTTDIQRGLGDWGREIWATLPRDDWPKFYVSGCLPSHSSASKARGLCR